MVHNQMTTATQLTLKELFFLRKKSLATKKAIPLHDFGCGVSIYGIVKNLDELTIVQRRIDKDKNFYC